LAELTKTIEEHYGKAQDIEFAVDRDLPFPENIFIVQSRPETVWGGKEEAPGVEKPKPLSAPTSLEKARVVVKGIAAGRRATGTGVAKVAPTVEDASKLMQKGDILVTTMTNPDYVPFMRIASAIVTDKGGVTAHAAIVSRELGIPCIVGTEIATKVMKTGQEYTVDASSGVVYEGIVAKPEAAKPVATAALTEAGVMLQATPVTATRIYMNLGVPEKIEEYKNLPFDGIGLMRIEFILASYIGQHPVYLLETGQADTFVSK
jgi:pyruvate,water dikinase